MPECPPKNGWSWFFEGFVGGVLKSWKPLSFNFSNISYNKQKNEKDLLGPQLQLLPTERNYIV